MSNFFTIDKKTSKNICLLSSVAQKSVKSTYLGKYLAFLLNKLQDNYLITTLIATQFSVDPPSN